MTLASLPASVFRGGTSKGVYFRGDDMPADGTRRDALLLSAFGSPDPMQIDGIGGSHSTTSKAMIVDAADGNDVDIEYEFGGVAVEKPVVDWGGNCGNLTFAIGPYALEAGIVDPAPGVDRLELLLRNQNTGDMVTQSVPLDGDGFPRYEGNCKVYGVPGTGGRITSRFHDPGGSVTGEVFPTDHRTEELPVPDLGLIGVSIVDVASPCVFVRAADVDVDATVLPAELDRSQEVLDRLEAVRSAACERLGFVDDATDATAESPGIPKLTIVGEQESYETVGGDMVEPNAYDLLARMLSMQHAHHAYAVTGGMCAAVAARIQGTIPEEVAGGDGDDEVVIGHPKGTMAVRVGLDGDTVEYTELDRTARQIMAGELYYRPGHVESRASRG